MSARDTFRRVALGFGIASILVGCTLGEGGDGDGDVEFPDRIPNPEPGADDRLDALGIVCESTLIVRGTFVEGEPPPADRMGCWEVGTWTIDMVSDDLVGCDPQPAIDLTFTYEISFDDENSQTEITYVDDPEGERMNLKVTTDGSGDCLGSFEHFGLPGVFPDNVLLQLQPNLQEGGTTIEGIGAYAFYEDDPF